MKADHDKSRVTFYYLLAERYGKLGMFHQWWMLCGAISRRDVRGSSLERPFS